MASTHNNFALLHAAQQAEAAAGKKKRRNNRKKGNAAPPLPPSGLEATLPEASAPRQESPFLVGGPPASGSFGQDFLGLNNQPDESGFRMAGRNGLRSASRSASTSSLPGANGDPGSSAQDFIEAALEQAVAASLTAEARRSLWRQWLSELEQASGGGGTSYPTRNGRQVDFQEALLSSQALEHMLEACIAQGIDEGHEADLQELLVAALELSEETGADLASALRMLCRLAATSADQSSHAQQLAQQTVVPVVSYLKQSKPQRMGSGRQQSLQDPIFLRLSDSVSESRSRYQRAQGARAQAQAAAEIVRHAGDKVDLLHSQQRPPPAHHLSVLQQQELLRRLDSLSMHAQDARKLQQQSAAHSRQAPSQAAQFQQLRNEEARLTREMQAVRENMEVLQAQLHSAAQQAQGVAQQLDLVRRQLSQQPQPASQARTANGSMAQMQKGASSQQLAAREAAEAQRLLAAVIQSAAQAQQGQTMEDEGDDDATAYLEALEQMLGCCVKQQNEALEKVAFQMERKLKAQRMAEEAQHLRDSASHTAAQKLAQNSHQAANEMLMGAMEMERAKQEAMADLLKRQPSLHAALPQARVAQHHQRIQELSAQAAQLHNAILAESTRQRPAERRAAAQASPQPAAAAEAGAAAAAAAIAASVQEAGAAPVFSGSDPVVQSHARAGMAPVGRMPPSPSRPLPQPHAPGVEGLQPEMKAMPPHNAGAAIVLENGNGILPGGLIAEPSLSSWNAAQAAAAAAAAHPRGGTSASTRTPRKPSGSRAPTTPAPWATVAANAAAEAANAPRNFLTNDADNINQTFED
ncbi:hypothetical protein WJX74_008346 [Apatococcus lobatus]|uniref:Uncharacterized protein n=2 Tax=Apatococcus TaxID=904362 RepID=A0AAW1SYJ7_9CHLO